jgi:EAL domain-containing protein (putative c-di-GMP-specific phosphodiesterase class I)/CheY-like chemotaxis protein
VQNQQLGRVLVVDDDAAIRRMCVRVLKSSGWDVIQAPDVKSALAELGDSHDKLDCVLSDVSMPDLDGYALVRALKHRDIDLPVLLMTGDPSLDGAVRALDYGAVSYITKPFSKDELTSAVARAARKHTASRMRRRAETPVPDDLEQRFHRALERSWMAFQPIVDVHEKRVFAYEALLRTDEETLRRTDHFIEAAEKLGKIHLLGRTVRDAVARAAAEAPDDVMLFVNVHGLELTDEELFAEGSPLAGMAGRVVLEITERTGLDPAAGPSSVAMLRKLGYRIAVDDLGAGYAALGALATLEPDVVKLDMSLIRDIDRQPTKRRVVGAIATLCRELGSKVVAEGVETAAEAAVVIDCGIELLQGYLYARPTRELVTVESLKL